MWEHYLNNFSDPTVRADYERVKQILTDSKKDLLTTGYDEIAIDDFWQTFLDQFKAIEELNGKPEEEKQALLQKSFCTEDWGAYMIMYA